jgi:hypothetical protein
MAKGLIVMLISKEVKRHWVLNSESDINKDLEFAFNKAYSEFQSKDTTIDHVRMRLFYNMKNRDYPALRAKVLSVIRGNRNIVINITSDTTTANQSVVDAILSSIRFNKEHESKEWHHYQSPDSTYAVWAPSSITTNQTLRTSIFERTAMAAYDTLTATSYLVLFDQPKPYYWVKNYEDLKDLYKEMLHNGEDSVVYQKDVVVNNMKGHEILIRKKDANTFKRSRIIFADKGTYILTVSSQKEALFTPNSDRFFTDFQQKAKPPGFDYLEPKTRLLLSALNAKDSAQRAGTVAYLKSAPFSAEDADLLHQSVFNAYKPLYDYSDSFDVSEIIAARLQEIKAPSTISYIKNYYPEIADNDYGRKHIALNILAGTHTSESYQTLALLLSNTRLSESPSRWFRRKLKDSLVLTSSITDKLLPLSVDSIYTPFVAALMSTLIDSGFVKPEVLKPFTSYFVVNAKKMKEAIKDGAEYDYQLPDLIELLPLLSDEEANKVLREFQYVSDMDLQITAVLALLEHGGDADTKIIERIALDKAYRVHLFEMLKKINKDHLFPPKLLNQRSFAESYVFNSSEDYTPEKIEFVGERMAKIGAEKCRFYLFRLIFDEEGEKSEFLGIAGGYTSDITLDEENNVTGIYFDEAFSKGKIDDLFKKYIDSVSEE